jgi:RNA polymerase sigma-70 factor, ECF subfamily
MTRAEELDLIERATAGDSAAAEAFIRAYQGSLYAYLLRMCGRPDTAEDIVQEAFIRVLTHLDRFDPRFRFSTWLFTIAKRLYMNSAQKHRPACNNEAVSAQRGGAMPETATIAAEEDSHLRDVLQSALLMLPPEQREVVVLFHQQDWPIWLIAQHMDMPEGTVKSHLHRGRKKLRKAMDEQGARAEALGEVYT